MRTPAKSGSIGLVQLRNRCCRSEAEAAPVTGPGGVVSAAVPVLKPVAWVTAAPSGMPLASCTPAAIRTLYRVDAASVERGVAEKVVPPLAEVAALKGTQAPPGSRSCSVAAEQSPPEMTPP